MKIKKMSVAQVLTALAVSEKNNQVYRDQMGLIIPVSVHARHLTDRLRELGHSAQISPKAGPTPRLAPGQAVAPAASKPSPAVQTFKPHYPERPKQHQHQNRRHDNRPASGNRYNDKTRPQDTKPAPLPAPTDAKAFMAAVKTTLPGAQPDHRPQHQNQHRPIRPITVSVGVAMEAAGANQLLKNNTANAAK